MAVPKELGPVEYVVIHFENGKFDGQGLLELVDLQQAGTIRVLDLVFIRRAMDGALTFLDYEDLDAMVDLEGAEPESVLVSLLSESDARKLAEDLEPGHAIGVVVFEDTWAIALQEAVGRAGGQIVEASRVPKDAVDAALAYAAEQEEVVG